MLKEDIIGSSTSKCTEGSRCIQKVKRRKEYELLVGQASPSTQHVKVGRRRRWNYKRGAYYCEGEAA